MVIDTMDAGVWESYRPLPPRLWRQDSLVDPYGHFLDEAHCNEIYSRGLFPGAFPGPFLPAVLLGLSRAASPEYVFLGIAMPPIVSQLHEYSR